MDSVQDIVIALLRDFGVESIDPADNATNRQAPGLTDGMIPECLIALNGAFQDIYRLAPSAFSELPYSDVLRAPTAVTFTATQYSKTISSFLTWASWMKGCTVQFADEETDNTLISATELARPVMGSSGSKTGTVYADALLLPSTFGHIIEPIEIPNECHLTVADSRKDFLKYAFAGSGNHFQGQIPGIGPKQNGIPRMVLIDTYRDSTTQGLPTFLRFAPMPSQAFQVEFMVKRKPPTYVPADVDSGDHTTDPNTLIPQDWVEAVLYAMARQRLTGCSDFSNEDGKPEIGRQFTAALAILEGSKPGVVNRRAKYPAPAGGGK